MASFILVASLVAAPIAGAGPSAQMYAGTPDTPFNVDLLSEFGGGTYTSMEASGGAWFAIRSGKLVVGSSALPMAEPVDTGIRGIAVYPRGDDVFVLRQGGFALVDCSNPSVPVLLGEFKYSDEVRITGFFATTAHAYFTFRYQWGSTGCKIVDLSDPANLHYDAFVSIAFDDLTGDVRGDCAYVKTPTGFRVYSLANPLAPVVVHTYTGTAPVADVTVSGGSLYLAYGAAAPSTSGGLKVFSLATPAAPTPLRDLPQAAPLVDVSVAATRAWTLDDQHRVRLYDVTVPSAPATQAGSAIVATSGANLAANGTNVFVRSCDADAGTSRVSCIDGSDPSSFAVVHSCVADGGLGGACIDGTVAYLTTAAGLAAYDVSNPSTPTTLPALGLPGRPRDVDVSGATGYVTYSDAGSGCVQRITGLPAGPAQDAKWTSATADVRRIDASGSLVAAAADEGLLLFDVSGAPIALAGKWASADPATDVLVDGTRAWLAVEVPSTDWSTVYELDITTPTAPVLLAEHGIPGDGPTLAKAGDTLYVGWQTATSSAVKIFDVAAPGSLRYVTSSDTGFYGCSDTASSKGATPTAVAVGPNGLRLIDAASPDMPFLGGFHPLGGQRADMSGDLVLVTDPDEGARLYRYTQVTDRDAGLTRYQTAVEASKEITSSVWVVLASGLNYPDALCGAPLAYARKAPVLLVQPDNIPDGVAARIRELGATKAIVLGGGSAIGQGVINDLAALGISGANVKRLAGLNRFETSKAIALELKNVLGAGSCGTAFIASGLDYPDALAAGGAASKKGAPILLVKPLELPATTGAALTSIGCSKTVVLGGRGAVSDSVKAKLPAPTRLGGVTRYETAKAIADYSIADPGCSFTADEVFVVTGLAFPDALPCGVVSAMHDAPTLLVNTGVPTATQTFVGAHAAQIGTVHIVGGAGAVPVEVEWALFGMLVPN